MSHVVDTKPETTVASSQPPHADGVLCLSPQSTGQVNWAKKGQNVPQSGYLAEGSSDEACLDTTPGETNTLAGRVAKHSRKFGAVICSGGVASGIVFVLKLAAVGALAGGPIGAAAGALWGTASVVAMVVGGYLVLKKSPNKNPQAVAKMRSLPSPEITLDTSKLSMADTRKMYRTVLANHRRRLFEALKNAGWNLQLNDQDTVDKAMISCLKERNDTGLVALSVEDADRILRKWSDDFLTSFRHVIWYRNCNSQHDVDHCLTVCRPDAEKLYAVLENDEATTPEVVCAIAKFMKDTLLERDWQFADRCLHGRDYTNLTAESNEKMRERLRDPLRDSQGDGFEVRSPRSYALVDNLTKWGGPLRKALSFLKALELSMDNDNEVTRAKGAIVELRGMCEVVLETVQLEQYGKVHVTIADVDNEFDESEFAQAAEVFEQAIWQEAMMAAEEVLFQEVPPEARPNGRLASEAQNVDQHSECDTQREPSQAQTQIVHFDEFEFPLNTISPGGYEGSLENSEKYEDTMEQFGLRENSYRKNVRFADEANAPSVELELEASQNAVKRQSKISIIAPSLYSDATSDHPKDA